MWSYLTISCVFVFALTVAGKPRLVITGFAGINISSRRWSGAGIIPSAELALEIINNNTDILPDHELVFDWKDSRCSSAYSIKSLVEAINEPPNKIAFLGPGCSIAATPVADAAKFWNVLQLGYSASSPDLYNPVNYPNLYITNPSEDVYGPALYALMKHFNWTKIFIVKHENSYSNAATESLEKELQNKVDVEIVGFLNDITAAIHRLKNNDARIMIFNMYEDDAREFACYAYINGFYGSHYVWILYGWYLSDWWEVPHKSCTTQDIKTVLINVITLRQAEYGDEKPSEITEMTIMQFQQVYKELLRKRNNSLYRMNAYASYSFDAVLVLASALNNAEKRLKSVNQSLIDFSYNRSDILAIIKEEMKSVNFVGVTGRINMESRKPRMVDVFVEQTIDFKTETVAKYHNLNKSISLRRDFFWSGDEVPISTREEVKILTCVSTTLLYWTTGSSFLGIFVALCFLRVNLKGADKSYLKISSPPLNNFIILGCIISYLFVPVFGLKSCGLSHYYSYSCKMQCFFLAVAFSLTFGTLFLKIWRIYRIFTNIKLTKQLRFLSNKHLISALSVMLFGDVVYMLTWNLTNPIHGVDRTIREESFLHSKKIHLALSCTSANYYYWVYGIAGQKCLLLLFGIFLTWETRNVSFPGLNDSKSVAMCVYSIVIFIIVVIPLQQFVKDDVSLHFGVVSSALVFCTTVTLLLLFLPKFFGSKDANTSSVTPRLYCVNKENRTDNPTM